jgi:hypothetical protein
MMVRPARSNNGPYRTRTGTRVLRGAADVDVAGLLILLLLFGSGLLPLIDAIASPGSTSGSANFGFVVVLGSLILIVREVVGALRRGGARRSGADSTSPPAGDEQ